DVANFSGLATEEGLTLPLVADINLSSLLLGGAVIGTLGALDDVTVTQVATVAELHHRNSRLTVAELITSGIRVGREHIASTVNTLLLAYAGASMPLLLVFAASDQPLGVVANSEIVAVEIVRTLCGSIGLVAAVPITTLMAAVLVGTTTDGNNSETTSTDYTPQDSTLGWEDFGPVDE
ncbi:MAG: YibE/F family protein, partial [bacterium]|nr:YibE/F family protein [bacterium]